MEEKEQVIIPDEELEIFDVDAKEMMFGDEMDNVSEQGDVPEEIVELREAPKTHGPEEALPEYNEVVE
jgi:hypothetical protein